MEKKKKIIIGAIVGVCALAVVITVLCFVFIKNDKEIDNKPANNEQKLEYTVTFDTDGGDEIESIKVAKGKTISLPENPKKEGYIFDGWTLEGEKFDLETKIEENITLKATWKTEENETENKEETTKPVSETKKENYKCPEGYTLEGTSCKKEIRKKGKATCPSGSFEVNGNCIEIKGSSRMDSVKKCKTYTYVSDNNGHTETSEGILITIPNAYSYCVYGVVTDSYEQQSQYNCTSRGHNWTNGKCYYAKTDPGKNMDFSCSNANYIYISNPNSYSGVNGLNSGCFPKVDYVVNCPDSSYSGTIHPVDGAICTKTETVPATKIG